MLRNLKTDNHKQYVKKVPYQFPAGNTRKHKTTIKVLINFGNF